MVLKDKVDEILSGKKYEKIEIINEDWKNVLGAVAELEEIQEKSRKILLQLLLVAESTQKYCPTKSNSMVLKMKSGEEIEFCYCDLNLFRTVFDLSQVNTHPGAGTIVDKMANLGNVKLLIMIDKEGPGREGMQIALKDIRSIKKKF